MRQLQMSQDTDFRPEISYLDHENPGMPHALCPTMTRYKLRIAVRQDDAPYHAPTRYLVTYVSAYTADHAIALVDMPRGYKRARDLIEVSEVR